MENKRYEFQVIFFILHNDGMLVKDFEMSIETFMDSLKDRCKYICDQLYKFDGLMRGYLISC